MFLGLVYTMSVIRSYYFQQLDYAFCYLFDLFQVWSYTHNNGASLVRATFPIAACPNPEHIEKGWVTQLSLLRATDYLSISPMNS